MPPKVLIIQPPLLLSGHFIDYPYFANLGAYRAAAVLEGEGIEVEVLDAFDRDEAGLVLPGKTAWLGEPKQTFIRRLERREAEVALIGGSPFLMCWPGGSWLDELIGRLKTTGAYLVLADMVQGGMHYLDYQTLEGPDLTLRYQGERLLVRLAEALKQGQRPSGVWAEREAFPLDRLPKPAYHLMDLESYFGFLSRVLSSSWRPGPFAPEPRQTLPLVTSRGCPYGCIFCSSNSGLEGGGRQVRFVPWPRVEEQVREWVERHGIRRLAVLDDVVNLDAERFDSLLDLLERLDLWAEFPNGLRADRIKEEQVLRLKDRTSGLKVSLESASPRVQNEILGKKLDPAAVERVSKWCHHHGVPLEVHLIIGIPGEHRSEMVETLRTAVRLSEEYGSVPRLQFATPLPGTELGKICDQQGLLSGDPQDLHAAFSRRPLIKSPDFDPDLLVRAKGVLERRLGYYREPKVITNLTYQCNNNCVFCAVADRERVHADTGEVLAALERYHREGYRLLDLDGGEPTLHPDLLEIIGRARELGYRKITMVTNGRRLSYPAFAEALAGSGLDELLVSLHAPKPRLQAEITGVAESFEQTTAGIEKMLDVLGQSERLGVNTTLVKNNLGEVERLGEFLARMGVRRWNLQLITPFGRARASQLPPDQELTGLLCKLLENPPGGMQLKVINCPPCLLPGHEQAAAVDFRKAEREMVFIGAPGENLQTFLGRRRKPDSRCDSCVDSLLCQGFYQFEADDSA